MDLNFAYHKLASEDQDRELTFTQHLEVGILSHPAKLSQLCMYIDSLGVKWCRLQSCGGFFVKRYVLTFHGTVEQVRKAILTIIKITS